jgi:hypothetical protein
MASLFHLTIFVSSYLLFLVQPMLAKMLLPQVGGAPSVWIVSMLFFQTLLLGGYSYAAFSSRFLSPLQQSVAQCFLYIAALVAYLPLAAEVLPSQLAVKQPEQWVLYTLLVTIGMPYFLLAANSSLLQRWYFSIFNREPYHLFSASNAGSFLGLFSYPFLWEWLWPLREQLFYWGGGFIIVSILFSLYPVLMHRLQHWKPEMADNRQQLGSMARGHVLRVIVLAFIPSSLFLSVTLYITTDIASLPLLWIIPLALYLLSFVVVFAPWGDRWISIAQKLHPYAILLFCLALPFKEYWAALFAHLIFYSIIILSVHGQLARIRPAPENLTIYYLWMSLGGTLGGLFNVLVPHLFNDVYEYALIMLLSMLALPSKGKLRENLQKLRAEKTKCLAAFVGMAITIPLIWFMPLSDEAVPEASSKEPTLGVMFKDRNFFGVSKVVRKADHTRFAHGTTLHGIQVADPAERLKPVSYYGPLYKLLQTMPDSFFERPFGVVGLGAGTLACYGRAGQGMEMFEIDPTVVAIAQNPDYFTYLRDCPPETTVYVGDGRIQLRARPDKHYHFLVLDAFTSDAIPFHLVTKEALALYWQKMHKPEGMLAFNVTNRYLHLAPFLARAGAELGLQAWQGHYQPVKGNPFIMESEWLLLTDPASQWAEKLKQAKFTPLAADEKTPLWTDQYSNPLHAIK